MQGLGKAVLSFAMLGVMCVNGALAQQFPSKPIRYIVPSGAGNATDQTARIIATKLGERRGWTVVVENRPGANYLLGIEALLKAPADGHAIFAGVSSLTVLPSTVKDLPYNVQRDLVPVTRAANLQQVLYISPTHPAKTMPELIAYAKANPGKVNYATLGLGTFTHLAGEWVKQLTGADMTVVPFKDMTGVVNVANGNVTVGIAAVASISSQVKAGRLRALAILSPTRSPLIPDVPTMGETGLPAIDADAWVGVMVAAGTPAAIVTTLNREISGVLALPEVREQFLGLGAAAVVESAEQMKKKVEGDIEGWGKVIRNGKLKFE